MDKMIKVMLALADEDTKDMTHEQLRILVTRLRAEVEMLTGELDVTEDVRMLTHHLLVEELCVGDVRHVLADQLEFNTAPADAVIRVEVISVDGVKELKLTFEPGTEEF